GGAPGRRAAGRGDRDLLPSGHRPLPGARPADAWLSSPGGAGGADQPRGGRRPTRRRGAPDRLRRSVGSSLRSVTRGPRRPPPARSCKEDGAMLRVLTAMIGACISASVGQILVRRGMLQLGELRGWSPRYLAGYFWHALTNPWVIAGTVGNALFYFLFLAV